MLFMASLALATPAMATQFPVSGSVTLAGNTASLPASTFGNSSYNPSSGYLSSGKFTFPQASFTNSTFFGPLTVTYQLSQTNTASAMVGTLGDAAFTEVDLKLHIVSANFNGSVYDVGSTCDFVPIVLATLGGNASSSVMTVSQSDLIVPLTSDDCGGFKDQINNIITNSTGNSISLSLDGNFTPPDDNDIIFQDGFE